MILRHCVPYVLFIPWFHRIEGVSELMGKIRVFVNPDNIKRLLCALERLKQMFLFLKQRVELSLIEWPKYPGGYIETIPIHKIRELISVPRCVPVHKFF